MEISCSPGFCGPATNTWCRTAMTCFLMTGNAGGIEITVDGKSVPAIGEPGVARDSVALVPERLLSGTAVDQ